MTFRFIDYQFEKRIKSPAFNQPLINIFERSDYFEQHVDDLAREYKIQGEKEAFSDEQQRESIHYVRRQSFAKLQVQALILVLYLELIKLVSFPASFHKKVFELEK